MINFSSSLVVTHVAQIGDSRPWSVVESKPLKDFIVIPADLPMSTKASRQSTLGYTHGSSLSANRCASYELDGDARHKQGFSSRFGCRVGVIPTSCVWLFWSGMIRIVLTCSRGYPRPSLYILWRNRVTSKVSYLIQYLVALRCTPTSVMRRTSSSCGPSHLWWCGPCRPIRV